MTNKAGYTAVPVADGWAGVEMRVFTVFAHGQTHGPSNQRTDGPMDRWMDKRSYRVACSQLKTISQ